MSSVHIHRNCNENFFISLTFFFWLQQIHLRIHSGRSRVKCHVCGKEQSNKKQLSDHMRLHTKEMPYMCEFCGKKFRLIVNLQVSWLPSMKFRWAVIRGFIYLLSAMNRYIGECTHASDHIRVPFASLIIRSQDVIITALTCLDITVREN